MKYLFNFIAIILLVFTQACRKNNLASLSSFNVTTDKTTYKVGDTIRFNISGNPYMITFFSGEEGKKFDNVQRVKVSGTPTLQFTSLSANGTQSNSLAIMVSTNFTGRGADEAATAANIAAATWTDITNRATLSTGASTPSGSVNLTDIASADKPVYIAFKYTGAAGSIQKRWTITGLSVINTLADGSVYTLGNLNNTVINNYGASTIFSPGWVGAKVANTYSWAISAGSSLQITGATTDAAATARSEAWVFSGPFYLQRVSPDYGVPIKNITARLSTYPYVYKKAGTYTATFEGRSETVFDVKNNVQQIQLTITP